MTLIDTNSLANGSIRLRSPEPSDVDILYEWENNMEIWTMSNTVTPFSKYLLKKYIETSQLDIWESKQLRLIIELVGQQAETHNPIGLVDLFDFDPFHSRAGVGILIAKHDHRHKGYATQALKIIIRYAFNTLLVHQLYSNISADNVISVNLFKKCGFVEVGVRKEWLKTRNGWKDEVILQHLSTNSLAT